MRKRIISFPAKAAGCPYLWRTACAFRKAEHQDRGKRGRQPRCDSAIFLTTASSAEGVHGTTVDFSRQAGLDLGLPCCIGSLLVESSSRLRCLRIEAKQRLRSFPFYRAKHLLVPQRRFALVLADILFMLQSQSVKPTSPFSCLKRRVGLYGGGQATCLASPFYRTSCLRLGQQSVCVVLWWNASTKARHTHFLCPSAVV